MAFPVGNTNTNNSCALVTKILHYHAYQQKYYTNI
jgi:hypothetical protein